MPGVSFNFLVPWQDTLHRALSFRATVNPAVGLGQLAQCAGCRANTFDLIGVPFVSTAVVPVHPTPLTVRGVQTGMTENQVFGSAQTVLPVKVRIFPYDAPLPVDGMSSEDATYAVNERGADDGLVGSDYPIGVFIDGTPNLGGLTLSGRRLYDQDGPVSIVRDDRPLTSAMHEIGHGLGLSHADTAPHPDGTVDCGGNSNGQVDEAWPLDNEGRIQGIGLDRRNWTIGQTGSLPQTVVEGFDQSATRCSATTSTTTSCRTAWQGRALLSSRRITGYQCATGTASSPSTHPHRRFRQPLPGVRAQPARCRWG